MGPFTGWLHFLAPLSCLESQKWFKKKPQICKNVIALCLCLCLSHVHTVTTTTKNIP